MKKLKENFLSYWKTHLVVFIVGLILGTSIFLLWFYLNEKSLFDAVNAATLAFLINFAVGMFIYLGSTGMFDGIVYGFGQVFTSAFARKANKMNNYAGYVEQKRIKRSHGPFVQIGLIAASLIFLVLLIVLEIIYHN